MLVDEFKSIDGTSLVVACTQFFMNCDDLYINSASDALLVQDPMFVKKLDMRDLSRAFIDENSTIYLLMTSNMNLFAFIK